MRTLRPCGVSDYQDTNTHNLVHLLCVPVGRVPSDTKGVPELPSHLAQDMLVVCPGSDSPRATSSPICWLARWPIVGLHLFSGRWEFAKVAW